MWLSVQQAAASIGAGGVVAYPTEAVYGLGCDPLNQAAVLRLLAIKQRPVSKGLILLADSSEPLRDWVNASSAEWQQMEARWPGPVTFLVPVSARVPDWIKGEHDKVAVRVSGHPLARELARAAGMPIVSTSANRAGAAAHRNAEPLEAELGAELDGVVRGECNISDRPSTIIDLASQTIIRA